MRLHCAGAIGTGFAACHAERSCSTSPKGTKTGTLLRGCFSRWSSRMTLDTAAAALATTLSALPQTLHFEVSTGLAVLGVVVVALWAWSRR